MPPRPNLLVLRCTDVDETAVFYERLGFRFVEERHGTGPRHLAADDGAFVLELYAARHDLVVDHQPRLGFTVEDLDGLCSMLGLSSDRPVATDPDGRKVELSAR